MRCRSRCRQGTQKRRPASRAGIDIGSSFLKVGLKVCGLTQDLHFLQGRHYHPIAGPARQLGCGSIAVQFVISKGRPRSSCVGVHHTSRARQTLYINIQGTLQTDSRVASFVCSSDEKKTCNEINGVVINKRPFWGQLLFRCFHLKMPSDFLALFCLSRDTYCRGQKQIRPQQPDL